MSNETPQIKAGPVFPLLLTGKSEAVIGESLTYKQELFCRYYTQNEETLMNGVLSYAEAYGFDLENMSHQMIYSTDGKEVLQESEYKLAYHYCGFSASRLLKNDKISRRINYLFNELMREEVIDAQLMKIIMKGKDNDKLGAIKHWNELKQRITKKLDLTTKGESLNVEDRNKVNQALESIF